MQFINTILLAATALASIVSATNTVQFVNQANIDKTIIFTANIGLPAIAPLSLPASTTLTQEFPAGWLGNFYSVDEGAANVPGMLGEVAFQGFAGATYFDVSSIVNPTDTEGVKQLFPLTDDIKAKEASTSGCNMAYASSTTECTSQYNAWNDIATVSSPLTSLVCLVGTPEATKTVRRSRVFAREYVTGAVKA